MDISMRDYPGSLLSLRIFGLNFKKKLVSMFTVTSFFSPLFALILRY